MATIEKRNNKKGLSYKIIVSAGYDIHGNQIRHFKTWAPPQGMGEKRADKEVLMAAAKFETEIKQGYQIANHQTFHDYALYVIDLKKRNGAKPNTIRSYTDLMARIDPIIGHMKLGDIRPQHLNNLYKTIQAPESRLDRYKAIGKENISEAVKASGMTRTAIAEAAGISASTVTAACRRQTIKASKAEAIANTLNKPVKDLFLMIAITEPLSNKTVLEHHRFIHTVLEQAEKEMLVPYNAASKASPPSASRKLPAYYQSEQITAILDALQDEPEKWRVITHLLIVTGCRRGEIMALKWDKVNLEDGILEISANLCYLKELGTYEVTTKTDNVRYIGLPDETVSMLWRYKASQAKLQEDNQDRWKGTGYLFTQDNGLPMNPDSITGWLNKFSKRRGLPHIHPHAFRHSVASLLIAEGTDIVTVAGQLGHSQASTTSDIYAHVISAAKAKATDTIADVLLRRKKA